MKGQSIKDAMGYTFVGPDDFKQRREMLGLTQQKFAERLGLARRTVQYYESGELDIPRTVKLALQALELEYK